MGICVAPWQGGSASLCVCVCSEQPVRHRRVLLAIPISEAISAPIFDGVGNRKLFPLRIRFPSKSPMAIRIRFSSKSPMDVEVAWGEGDSVHFSTEEPAT